MFLLSQSKPELVHPCSDHTNPRTASTRVLLHQQDAADLHRPAPSSSLPQFCRQHKGFKKSYKDILLGSGNSSNLRNQQ